jgi:GNAT superfamily N-acetyltransferase
MATYKVLTLKDGQQAVLKDHDEDESVRDLLNLIIQEGSSYPQRESLDLEAFQRYWLSHRAYCVYVENTLVAAFFLRPNHPGRCSHIANGGFIVHPNWRSLGLGRFMGEAALEIAGQLGFQAIQFNLIFASNLPSLTLWLSLGFTIVGRTPQAVALDHGGYEDALLLHRYLHDV